MKEFFDTSVLVAAFWRGHRDHEASLKRIATANKKKSSCALHTLAEVYATMTAMPVKAIFRPIRPFFSFRKCATVLRLSLSIRTNILRQSIGQRNADSAADAFMTRFSSAARRR